MSYESAKVIEALRNRSEMLVLGPDEPREKKLGLPVFEQLGGIELVKKKEDLSEALKTPTRHQLRFSGDPRLDMMPFSTVSLRKKRMRKKFLHMSLARLPVPRWVIREYVGHTMASWVRTRMDYVSIGRKLFSIEPLPPGALPVYPKMVSVGPLKADGDLTTRNVEFKKECNP